MNTLTLVLYAVSLAIGGLWSASLPRLTAAVPPTNAPQWQEVELTFTATRDGTKIRRPMFWDGGRTFRVRFASTKSSGAWRWTATDPKGDPGIQGRSGTLQATANQATAPTPFSIHGFWSIPPGGRNLIHADGTPRLLCADTAWALPWRATLEQVETYARDRSAKGFNAVLLMTVQPDMKAVGPRSRTEDLGFDVGFEDLPEGTLRQLNPAYFQIFDKLVDVLVAHGIAPVYQRCFMAMAGKDGAPRGL